MGKKSDYSCNGLGSELWISCTFVIGFGGVVSSMF